jgi:tetratricopeptide (TPR) repeat protein
MQGTADMDEGRADKAEPALRRAIELARAVGSTELEVRALYRLGDALMLLERPGEALAAFEQSLTGAEARGFWIDRVLAGAGAATAALEVGERERAAHYAERTVALLPEIGLDDVHEGQLVGWRLGRVFQALGDPRAASFLSQARAVATRRGDTLPTPERRQRYLDRGFVRAVFDDPAPPGAPDPSGRCPVSDGPAAT